MSAPAPAPRPAGDSADLIVVGAGHAGAEAALAAARLGLQVTVVTLSARHAGRLSCNPAVGGLAKGHLVREIDALGGMMAMAADEACVQHRRLNTRKGLAVQASRAQVDIDLYPAVVQRHLWSAPGVSLAEGEAAEVLTTGGRVSGLRLASGRSLWAPAVVLTTGTFLGGVLHCGDERRPGGRVGDAPATALSGSLASLGLRLGRLKTGTPPRVHNDSVDWHLLERQDETAPDGRFSFTPVERALPPIDCFITWTDEAVHAAIRAALHRSPLHTGAIVGRGPRYCPSVEDKVVRFADKDRHQIFLEPEGHQSPRVYLNGFSTSLPAELQEDLVRAIPGLSRAQVLQHGYAVEYDFSDPRDLDHGLQHKGVPGLFLAGQINGTSGYEEAAAQGLVAGASAARGAPLALGRDEAYIGVLVDDLVTRGVGGEPYRMFSSRAEHRLLLREDNADRRLMPKAQALGLLSAEAWARFSAKQHEIDAATAWCSDRALLPEPATLAALAGLGLAPIKNKLSVAQLLARPEVGWAEVGALCTDAPALSPAVEEQVLTDLKYAGYLGRERWRADRRARLDAWRLPAGFEFRHPGLSREVSERLERARPETLGAAARLPGVTPAAIDVLVALLGRGGQGSPRPAAEHHAEQHAEHHAEDHAHA